MKCFRLLTKTLKNDGQLPWVLKRCQQTKIHRKSTNLNMHVIMDRATDGIVFSVSMSDASGMGELCVGSSVRKYTPSQRYKSTKLHKQYNVSTFIDRALTGLVQQKKYSSKCKRIACLFLFCFFACWSVGNRAAYYWEGSVSPPLALPFRPTKDPSQTFRHPDLLKHFCRWFVQMAKVVLF